ncbi:MAG TPA: ATP-binding cassette domain-containing protein [Streptosporangiaceae bacterium]
MTDPQPIPALQSGALVSIAEVTKTYPACPGDSGPGPGPSPDPGSVGGGRRIVAVDRVALDLAPASVTAVTGPSGSGKSTLLRLVGGLERPDAGVIAVDTEQVTALPPRALPGYRRRIGLVFERDLLIPDLSVLDNVRVAAPARTRADRAATADLARELLDFVGLPHAAGARPGRLAPADRQRVAIARALFGRPGLLLADEPTGALGSEVGGEIVDLVVRIRDEYGTTVLIATHDPEIAIRCDRVVRLRDGRVADDSAALA